MDLETQTDDLRTSLESAFDSAETATDTPTETTDTTVVSDRTRDETGKFAKAEPKAEFTAPEPVAAPEISVKRPPSSWKKETQAEWDKLPPHVQDDVLRREGDFHKGIETYKQAAARAQEFDHVVAPYSETLHKLGVTAQVAVGELLKVDDILRNGAPHEKAQRFAQLARDYGIPLDHIQNPPQVDPAYQQVLNELQTLKRDSQTRAQAETAQLNSQIVAFAEGKEHFNAVREDMAALLQANRAADLETAYDMAIWARPDLRSGLLEQQTRATEEKARAAMQQQKAKSASVSVRGSSPVSSQSAAPTDIRAALEAAFNT